MFLSTIGRWLLPFLLLVAGWSVGEEVNHAASAYRLGAGDKIQIYVFNEPDLSLEYTLSDAGTISYPFLGEIHVGGLTVGQLEQRIIDGLKGPYLIDPTVNITIREYRQFFIYGEVTNSGGYAYQPGLTLRQAISIAGGLGSKAQDKKILVIRDSDPARQPRLIGMDDPVFAGDTITVDKGLF
jgi:polysaccharide export outer membrane protein